MFHHYCLSALVCESGHFGKDCRERCSGNCLNNETCDYVSGKCSSGCQDGYTGTLCKKSKI